MKKRSCEDYFGESKMRFYFLVCRKPTSRSALYVSKDAEKTPIIRHDGEALAAVKSGTDTRYNHLSADRNRALPPLPRCRLAAVQLGCAIALGEENRLRWVPTP